MKCRLMLVIIPLAALLVLAGCAGATSTPQGTQPTQPPSTTGATTPTTPSQAQVVRVNISDNGISADRSTFTVGMSYHFVVTNTGQATSQFMMGRGGWGWQNDRMPMGWRHQMMAYQSYQIAPGATQSFDYTLPASAVGQPFGFGCQMGGQRGMWYPVVVQPHTPPTSGGTQITIQNLTYQPATLQVRVGTTVTWTNRDNVAHSVTFRNGMKDSGLFSQGQSFSYTFNTPGTYQYSCTVHPSMVATVIVTS